jgi:hypothetical protein
MFSISGFRGSRSALKDEPAGGYFGADVRDLRLGSIRDEWDLLLETQVIPMIDSASSRNGLAVCRCYA